MKYERIERTLEETIEFFDEIKWSIVKPEKDLLNNVKVVEYFHEHHIDYQDLIGQGLAVELTNKGE